jgi:hypothetical protein
MGNQLGRCLLEHLDIPMLGKMVQMELAQSPRSHPMGRTQLERTRLGKMGRSLLGRSSCRLELMQEPKTSLLMQIC